MRLSSSGLALLREFEGYCSTAYRDPAGLLTLGYGHRVRSGEFFPNGVTPDRAEELLAADVTSAEEAIDRHVTVPLSQNQFDALVDFVYNLGEGRLAGSTLLRQLNRRNYGVAGQQILRWDRCGSAISAGLHRRREAEFALWNSAPAPEKPADSCEKGDIASIHGESCLSKLAYVLDSSPPPGAPPLP
jgi:lysozyme